MTERLPLRLQQGPLKLYATILDGCPNLEHLVRLLPDESPLVWLDSARTHPETGRYSLLGFSPWIELRAEGNNTTVRTKKGVQKFKANPLSSLSRVLKEFRAPAWSSPPVHMVGLMGYLSYELNGSIEHLPEPRFEKESIPEMCYFGMRLMVIVDHLKGRSWILSIVDPYASGKLANKDARNLLSKVRSQLHSLSKKSNESKLHINVGDLKAVSTHKEFEAMVLKAKKYIRKGDIFQANISQKFEADWEGSSFELYRLLRQVNPSPFACFIRTKELDIISCSPERLVRIKDGKIDTRPIAGTRPRGITSADDAIKSLELLLSEKERAEHIMLVDLERNDIGRVCKAGSVNVDEFMALESYSHVIHIVSNVSGMLKRGIDSTDIIKATFPGGTITGCPKVRCMEIIRELEPVRRGLYTGSIGYIGFDGSMDLNIAIRTIVARKSHLSFHVGAGIVADSDPAREYDETLAKAGALLDAMHSKKRISTSLVN